MSASLPPATQKNMRDAETKMKVHLENIKKSLDGRQVEFVVEQDLVAIHNLAQSMGFPNDWPEIIYDMSLKEIATAIAFLAKPKKPLLRASLFNTFTGNKIIFRIPSLHNPDGKENLVAYSFEDGNLVCSRGSKFNYNIDRLSWHTYIEGELKSSIDVSGVTSGEDVEKLWIEAINNIARRKNFDQSYQDTLEQIVKKGAKVDLAKFGDYSNLTEAAFLLNAWQGESNLKCIEFLVDKGADVYAIIKVAVYHSVPLLKRLLTRQGVDVNHQDVDGKTFLHYAAEEYEDPKLVKKLNTDGRTPYMEEVWVDADGDFVAWKTDKMHSYYDKFFEVIKSIPGIDVTVKDKNGRTALDLARHMNNIWILPGLETFHNSKSPQSPAKSTPQPNAGAAKKMPVGKPQSPTVAKFNGQASSASPKLPKELLSLLDVMYRTIKQSASDTTELEQEYQKFSAVFNAKK